MKKIGKVILPIIIISIFIIIMNSGAYLKRPLSKDDDVHYYLKAIEKNIYNEDWDMAEENLTYLEKAWDKVMLRIQITVEGARINDFISEMAHLRGAVHSKSQDNSIIEIETLIDVWDRLEE